MEELDAALNELGMLSSVTKYKLDYLQVSCRHLIAGKIVECTNTSKVCTATRCDIASIMTVWHAAMISCYLDMAMHKATTLLTVITYRNRFCVNVKLLLYPRWTLHTIDFCIIFLTVTLADCIVFQCSFCRYARTYRRHCSCCQAMEAAAEVTKARARADSMPSTVLDTGKGEPDQVLQLSTKYRENIWRRPLAPARAHLGLFIKSLC